MDIKDKNYKIAITTGDKLGIGRELVEKSLEFLKLNRSDVLIIGENVSLSIAQNQNRDYAMGVAIDYEEGYDTIVVDEEDNGAFCFKSLEIACDLAKKGIIKGIVTAPVSKEVLHKSGYNFNGQTEILEHFLSKEKNQAQMIFIADDLKVMLLTRHCSLSDVKLEPDEIIKQVQILNNFLIEKYGINNPKIALCALNPHAGEGGILGREEIDILNPLVQKLQTQGIEITKPMSADGLFARIGKEYLNNEKLSYDAILACYHDQGLCPVKALAFDKAVNTTIGLPIIRTSPSCGTAYDIAGKNIANPSGMIEAIKLAMKLA